LVEDAVLLDVETKPEAEPKPAKKTKKS
jgi:hypothetical protein